MKAKLLCVNNPDMRKKNIDINNPMCKGKSAYGEIGNQISMRLRRIKTIQENNRDKEDVIA